MFESINTQLHNPSASYNVMQYMLWRPLCKHIIWTSDIGSCTVNWYLFFDYNGKVRNNQCFVPHTRGWLCKVLTEPHIVRLYTHSRIRGMIKSNMLKAIRFWWCIWKISSTNTTMNCVNQLIRVWLCALNMDEKAGRVTEHFKKWLFSHANEFLNTQLAFTLDGMNRP